MRIVIIGLLALATLFNCRTTDKSSRSGLRASGVPVGQLKGYQKISSIIRARILKQGAEGNRYFDLSGRYFSSMSASFYPSPVALLMGSFTQSDAATSYKNGTPNSVNMMLWNTALSELAYDMSLTCAKPDEFLSLSRGRSAIILGDQLTNTIAEFCGAWPLKITDDHMHKLWIAIMSYDAPQSAEIFWRQSVLDAASPYRAMNGREATSGVIRSILLNPWFLLET